MTKKLLIMIALGIVQIACGMEEEKNITIITKDNSNGIKVAKNIVDCIPQWQSILEHGKVTPIVKTRNV